MDSVDQYFLLSFVVPLLRKDFICGRFAALPSRNYSTEFSPGLKFVPCIAFIVVMADMKRKRAFETKSQPGNIQKKHKKEEESHRSSELVEPVEAETDSDPIIESDTTSQSGEDDGVSWPSDNEGGDGQKEVESWEGASEGDSGVGEPGFDTDSVIAPQAKPKSKSTDGMGTGNIV